MSEIRVFFSPVSCHLFVPLFLCRIASTLIFFSYKCVIILYFHYTSGIRAPVENSDIHTEDISSVKFPIDGMTIFVHIINGLY
jgi:hypothetical protein